MLAHRRAMLIEGIVLIAILALAAWLRFSGLDRTSLFGDEAVYSGQAAALAGNPASENNYGIFLAHPLLFYLLLAGGFVAGLPAEGGRVLTALFGVASVAVAWGLGRQVGGRFVGVGRGIRPRGACLPRVHLASGRARRAGGFSHRVFAVRLRTGGTGTVRVLAGGCCGGPGARRPHQGDGPRRPSSRRPLRGHRRSASHGPASMAVGCRLLCDGLRSLPDRRGPWRRSRIRVGLPALPDRSAGAVLAADVRRTDRSVLRLALHGACRARYPRGPVGSRPQADRCDMGGRPAGDPPSVGPPRAAAADDRRGAIGSARGGFRRSDRPGVGDGDQWQERLGFVPRKSRLGIPRSRARCGRADAGSADPEGNVAARWRPEQSGLREASVWLRDHAQPLDGIFVSTAYKSSVVAYYSGRPAYGFIPRRRRDPVYRDPGDLDAFWTSGGIRWIVLDRGSRTAADRSEDDQAPYARLVGLLESHDHELAHEVLGETPDDWLARIYSTQGSSAGATVEPVPVVGRGDRWIAAMTYAVCIALGIGSVLIAGRWNPSQRSRIRG